MILLVALCGEKVHLADAKKCTLGRYGVIFPSACCGKKVHIPVERLDFACLLAAVAKCGCEKVHILKKMFDFLCACCGEKVHIHRRIWRRKTAHSEGKV